MFLPLHNVFATFQAVLSMSFKFTDSLWPITRCPVFRIYGKNCAQTGKTFRDRLTPCSQCLFWACLALLRNPLHSWYGAAIWLSWHRLNTGTRNCKDKNPSKSWETLQGLKLINSRNFYWACAHWNVFKAGFPEKQQSSSSSKGLIQNKDSHKHSRGAASTGQAMCVFFLQSHTHGSGVWSIDIENKALAAYGKWALTSSQIFNSLKRFKEIF